MEIFSKELIFLNQEIVSKGHAINLIIEFLYKEQIIADIEEFRKAVFDREEIMSTGIGRGIAIPHGRCKSVNKLACVLLTLGKEIEFDSIDGDPVSVIFMVAIPEEANNEYMKILGQISKHMREADQRNNILSAKSVDEAYKILKEIEDEI
jgi:fructose-specific phosphotransferase system IIA component